MLRDLNTQIQLHAKAESEAQKRITAAQFEAQQARTARDEAKREFEIIRSQMVLELDWARKEVDEQREIHRAAEAMCKLASTEVSQESPTIAVLTNDAMKAKQAADEAQLAAEKTIAQLTSKLEAAQRDIDIRTHLYAKAESDAQKKVTVAESEVVQAQTARDEARREAENVRSQMASDRDLARKELEEQLQLRAIADEVGKASCRSGAC